ncbi:MAG TPA: hypothetical protein VEB22_03660 [Phycisphaerales bacterium]|nr:hypothetical protein [Phycisphaerales bacterium]
MTLVKTRPGNFRTTFRELPDGRKELTRFYTIGVGGLVNDSLVQAWGAVDTGPATGPTAGFAGLRLVDQYSTEEQLDGVRKRVWVEVYQELPATAEQLVGRAKKIKLEDGRDAWEYTYLQFTAGAYSPGTVGASTAPDDGSLFLQREEATDTGCLRTIVRTYVEGGLLDQRDESKNNGKLLIRILVHAKTVPGVPAGYVLIYQDIKRVNGHPVYTYTFAKGDGEIARETDYGQSSDAGTTGVTRLTITHLTASSVSSDPTSAVGYAKIAERRRDEDGHRVWVVVYAKGTGLVLDERSISKSGALVVYHRVALGSAPSAPSATISGTVTEFERSARNDNGWVVHDYRWAEGNGQASINTRSEADGALLYTVVDLDAAAATPAYPGSGTGYLVSLTQEPSQGFFVNTAVYKKPPGTRTHTDTFDFPMPGLATFTGTDLTLSPPVVRRLKATFEVSYDTTELADTPFSVSSYASIAETYIAYKNPDDTPTPGSPPADTTTLPPVTNTRGLGGYLAGSAGTADDNDYYRGVFCKSYSFALVSSVPSSRPTGATVLYVRHEDYLTALDGTRVLRRTKISYTF